MPPDMYDLGFYLFRPFEMLMEYVVHIRTKFGWQAGRGKTAAAKAGDVEPPKEKPRPPSGGKCNTVETRITSDTGGFKFNSVNEREEELNLRVNMGSLRLPMIRVTVT